MGHEKRPSKVPVIGSTEKRQYIFDTDTSDKKTGFVLLWEQKMAVTALLATILSL